MVFQNMSWEATIKLIDQTTEFVKYFNGYKVKNYEQVSREEAALLYFSNPNLNIILSCPTETNPWFEVVVQEKTKS